MMDNHSKLPNADVIQRDDVRGSIFVLDHGSIGVSLSIMVEERNP